VKKYGRRRYVGRHRKEEAPARNQSWICLAPALAYPAKAIIATAAWDALSAAWEVLKAIWDGLREGL
jgi:hypothetical protein